MPMENRKHSYYCSQNIMWKKWESMYATGILYVCDFHVIEEMKIITI